TVTTASTVYAFNQQLALVAQIGQIFGESLQYTSSLVVSNMLYIGTQTKGIYMLNLNNQGFYENYVPAGPLRNKVYSIKATSDNLWCVFGDSDYQLNPYTYGLSKFRSEEHTSELQSR